MMTKTPYAPLPPIWGGDPICAMESDKFYAAIFNEKTAVRIDVVRKDMQDGITWDELQRIKSECGYGDMDAVEYYPKDRDVFNTGNVRHLFIMKDEFPFIRRASNG